MPIPQQNITNSDIFPLGQGCYDGACWIFRIRTLVGPNQWFENCGPPDMFIFTIGLTVSWALSLVPATWNSRTGSPPYVVEICTSWCVSPTIISLEKPDATYIVLSGSFLVLLHCLKPDMEAKQFSARLGSIFLALDLSSQTGLLWITA